MKKLYPVDISIDACMDADDLGQRVVDCVKEIDPSNDIVNIVKVHLGDLVTAFDAHKILKACLIEPLKEKGITNCIFVPIKKDLIEDITIDYIKVRDDELDT